MLRPRFALISLSLASIAASAIQAQVVRERLARPVPAGAPTIASPAPGEGTYTLARPMAGPTNLTATGTPATASLRWDAAPGASGYYVSRTDAAGATVRLTANPIAATSYEDLSGGVKPGVGYTYHVTATHPNGGAGTAQVSFTPPAAEVPAWVRVEPRGGAKALVWAPVPGAWSYQIIESWTEPITYTQTSPDGRSTTTSTSYYSRTITHGVTATEMPLPFGDGVVNHRFDVGAAYPPSGVTAPRAQWKYVVVP